MLLQLPQFGEDMMKNILICASVPPSLVFNSINCSQAECHMKQFEVFAMRLLVGICQSSGRNPQSVKNACATVELSYFSSGCECFTTEVVSSYMSELIMLLSKLKLTL